MSIESMTPAHDTGSPASSSGRSCKSSTSRPFCAVVRPPRAIERKTMLPDVASRTSTTPLARRTSAPVRVAVTGVDGAAGAPGASRKPAARADEPTACPVHFKVPSGQYASGHDCTGTALPSSARNANVLSRGSWPLAHGTPQLVPVVAAG